MYSSSKGQSKICGTQSLKDFTWSILEYSVSIVNCFRKMGISSSSLDLAQTAGNDPFKELNEELPRLREINPTEYEMLGDEFLGQEDNVCATMKYTITNEEILSSPVSNADYDENDNHVVEEKDVPPRRLPTEELEETTSAILRAALDSSEHGLEMHTLANVKTFSRKPEYRERSKKTLQITA